MPTCITDIHAHVVPGVDDGPADTAEACELLAAFRESGTQRVFCTPHFLSPHFDVEPEAVAAGFQQVERLRSDADPELALGAEVRMTSALVDYIRSGDVPTLGATRYVLVEFRSDAISSRALQLVHELRVRGYVPVMAHPERNMAVQKDPSKLDELLELGVLLQLTARCFEVSPREGHAADKLAWRMLEEGKAAVIATDAHDTRLRPPGLLRAYDAIAARLGQGVADALIENANAIWEDMPVQEIRVEKPKRGFFRALFG